MPELAEVETFRTQIEKEFLGEQIVSFESRHKRSTRRHSDLGKLALAIEDQKIEKVLRNGKYLSFQLSSGECLNVHLRMSGRFLMFDLAVDSSDYPLHSHVVLKTKRMALVFIDPRTFGEFWLTKDLPIEALRGIDAVNSTKDERISALAKFKKSTRPVKSILLDQMIISGIGNIYADEICAASKIRPNKKMSQLTKNQLELVATNIYELLCLAIEDRGSSLRDESFKDLYGEIGNYQKRHIVHARKTCRNCEHEITKTKVAGRSTYFCPKCQK